jgi:hypothetical protein
MKNIHQLITQKPSRLFDDGIDLYLSELKDRTGHPVSSYNIFITCDENIEEGDYGIINNEVGKIILTEDGYEFLIGKGTSYVYGDYHYLSEVCKKIILTTDPKLIKEGIQAIDDEFLEWFVKNPSCEEVEVEDWYNKFLSCCRSKKECHCDKKRIIIPKEELKQGIDVKKFEEKANQIIDNVKLEEVAEKHANDSFIWPLNKHGERQSIPVGQSVPSGYRKHCKIATKHFIAGAKWKEKNSYSEEEVLELLELYDNHIQENFIPSKTILSTKKWFEKIKKKS